MEKMRFGGRTVDVNLTRAVADGNLVLLSDGRFTLPPRIKREDKLSVKSDKKTDCRCRRNINCAEKKSMIQWLQVAYKINDNTYLSFTSYSEEELIDVSPV